MGIQLASAPPCGNAAALYVHPRSGTTDWVVLRKLTDDFTGSDDAGAATVASGHGDTDAEIYDWDGLLNGTTYFYRLYCDDALSGHTVSVTPAYQVPVDLHVFDPVRIVRERVELGLKAELDLGNLSHEDGAIPVLAAPPKVDTAHFPCVTVQLAQRSAEVRGIGEELTPDYFSTADDLWHCIEGWVDRTQISVIGWSLNPEGRNLLRDALQRVLMLNLPLFSAAGLQLPELSDADDADYERFAVDMYMSQMTLSCIHAAVVREQVQPIRTIEVYPHAEPE